VVDLIVSQAKSNLDGLDLVVPMQNDIHLIGMSSNRLRAVQECGGNAEKPKYSGCSQPFVAKRY
jgi:hypothetical protein